MEVEELKPEAVTCPHCQHVMGGAVAYCPFCGERQPVPGPSPDNADTFGTSSATVETTATQSDDEASTLKASAEAQGSAVGGGGAAEHIEEKREVPPESPKDDNTVVTSGETGGGANPTDGNAGYGGAAIHVGRTGRFGAGGGAARKIEEGEAGQSSPKKTEERDDGRGSKPSRLPWLILICVVFLLAVWGIGKIRQADHATTEQRYSDAFHAYQSKRLTEAKRMLEVVLHDNPDDTRARDLNAKITATLQRHDDMYKRAVRELESGHKKQARKRLLTIAREDSDNTKVRDLLEQYWSKREPDPATSESSLPSDAAQVSTSDAASASVPDAPPAPTPEPAPRAVSKHKQAKTVDCQALEQKVQEDIKGFYVPEAGNLASQAAKGQCPQAETLRRKVEDAKANIPNWQWKSR